MIDGDSAKICIYDPLTLFNQTLSFLNLRVILMVF